MYIIKNLFEAYNTNPQQLPNYAIKNLYREIKQQGYNFENDISLRSEFVRLALQDDSLSESERNRLISCGWNALIGKGVSAE